MKRLTRTEVKKVSGGSAPHKEKCAVLCQVFNGQIHAYPAASCDNDVAICANAEGIGGIVIGCACPPEA